MKRIAYLFFILFSCFIIAPNVYAQEDIAIKSITLDSKSDRVKYKDLEFNGLEFNTSIDFVDVNDYAKFNVVIENNTNKDYTVNEDKAFSLSDYVEYRYSSDQVIKHNSTSTISVVFRYANEVDPSLFNDDIGGYTESNNAVVELMDAKTGEVINPKTGINTNIVLLIAICIILNVIALLFIRNKSLSLVLFIFMCLIPSFMYALEELHITMDVDVYIAKKYKVAYTNGAPNILLKDEDIDENVITIDCKKVYLGSVSEENKYNLCEKAIIYDPKEYIFEDTVELKTINFKYVSGYDQNDASTYVDLNNGSYLIEKNNYIYFTDIKNDLWVYDKDYIDKFSDYGFIYRDNDIIKMNFSNLLDNRWEDAGSIFAERGSFVIPNHDVLIIATQKAA